MRGGLPTRTTRALERWAGMADAETAVVHGRAPRRAPGVPARHRVASRCRARGFPPTDGPDTCTAGTLFPRSSKKAARAINAASAATGRWWCWRTCRASTARRSRCATCSWSTAPRSAGRIVNFDGPIVFVVISRYHGGAFVVFSKALNANMTVLARRGLVRLGASAARPAAAVVFAGEVDKRTAADPRVRDAGGAAARRPPARAGRAASSSWPTCGPPCGPRSSARSRPSSTACTTSTGPSRSARWTR